LWIAARQRLASAECAMRALSRIAYQMPLLPSFGTPRSRSSQASTSPRVRGSEQNSRNGSAT
jgi:hypothetical protein